MSRLAHMNLPNSLSVTRIFLVPLLVVVLLTKFEGRMILGVRKELVGAAIFGLASFTDWLDGYLARRRGQVTALGQFIDPFADKLLTIPTQHSLWSAFHHHSLHHGNSVLLFQYITDIIVVFASQRTAEELSQCTNIAATTTTTTEEHQQW